jgi:hypothetical protein
VKKSSVLTTGAFAIILSVLMGHPFASDNIVVPGARCGQFILGKTTEWDIPTSSESLESKGIHLQFSKTGVLNLVILSASDYTTDRQIRIGASEAEVVHAYGQGKVGNIHLIKSETVIGKVGEKVLFYPGIQFVFAKQQVWAIMVTPK